jgi:CRISPR/Cas system-associated exonuclease Cas4 (RecB family)
MQFSIIDNGNENVKAFENKATAQAKADELREMVDAPERIEVVQGAYESYAEYKGRADGGTVEVIDESDDSPTENNEDPQTPVAPENKSVSDDPIEWVPEHFVDEIQGVPAINRKGYAVLAEQYDIEVTREFVSYPSQTEFEYAEATATAVTDDGKEYSGFGSAHIDRGDDPELLGELAETRAMKRATAWATGVGMTAVSELKNEL